MSSIFEQMSSKLLQLSQQLSDIKAKQEAQEEIMWTIYYELKKARADLASHVGSKS